MTLLYQKTAFAASVAPLTVDAFHRSDGTGRLLIRGNRAATVLSGGDRLVDGFEDPNTGALYQFRDLLGPSHRHVKLLTIGGVDVVEGMPPASGNNGYDLPPEFFRARNAISFFALYRYKDWQYNAGTAYLMMASIGSSATTSQFAFSMGASSMAGIARRASGDTAKIVSFAHGSETTRWIAPLFTVNFATGAMSLEDLLRPDVEPATGTLNGAAGPSDSSCALARMFRRQGSSADFNDAFYGQCEGMEFWTAAATPADKFALRIRARSLVARMDAAEA